MVDLAFAPYELDLFYFNQLLKLDSQCDKYEDNCKHILMALDTIDIYVQGYEDAAIAWLSLLLGPRLNTKSGEGQGLSTLL